MAYKRRNRTIVQTKTAPLPSRVFMLFLALVTSHIQQATANFEFTGIERNFAIGIADADDDDFVLSRNNAGGFFPRNICRTISKYPMH